MKRWECALSGACARPMGRSEACGEAPAQFFSEDEFPDARVFWTVPIILGWDAFLIPENPDYFVFNGHDEVVSFVCRTKERYEQLLDAFKDWDIEKGIGASAKVKLKATKVDLGGRGK